MPRTLIALMALLWAGGLAALPAKAQEEAGNWRRVDPENLILLELPTGQAAIELFPDAAPAHAAQLRAAARSGFYDGKYFYRVVEGHVAQAGGEFEAEISDWPTLPFEAEREISPDGFAPLGNADLFTPEAGHRLGFAAGRAAEKEWLLNCPGALGMARDTDPASGSTEIFIPLQPRRYLDRNYVIFGRVIDGMEHIHRLPRVDPTTPEETDALYGDDPELAYQMRQYRRSRLGGNAITSARIAADLPEAERPSYEVMAVPGAEWEALKESRRDYSRYPAFVSPGPAVLDICSLPVPARLVEAD